MASKELLFMDFIEDLDEAKNLDELFEALEKLSQLLGFECISYTYVPEAIGGSLERFAPIFKISKNYEQKFIDHYVHESFAEQDFTIKRIKQGDLSPMVWWHEAGKGAISDQEKKVIEVAREDYGLRNGLSIPTLSRGGSIAGVSVICREKDKPFAKLMQDNIRLLRHASIIFSDRVLARENYYSVFFSPLLERLSDTEKQLLQGLVKGMHLKQLAPELGISYKYAGNAMEKLRTKLGHVTREQLLYMVGTMDVSSLQG